MNFWNVLLWMGAIYLGFNFVVFLIKMMIIYRWYLVHKSLDDDEDDWNKKGEYK